MFPRIQPLGVDDSSSRRSVYSRHPTWPSNSENSSASFVMEYSGFLSRSPNCRFHFHPACSLTSSAFMRPWRCGSTLGLSRTDIFEKRMEREGGSNHRATCTSHLDGTIATDPTSPSHTTATTCMYVLELLGAWLPRSIVAHRFSRCRRVHLLSGAESSSAGGEKGIRWMCSGHHLLHSPLDPRAFVPHTSIPPIVLARLLSSSPSFISVRDSSCLYVLLATVFPCLHQSMTNSQGGSCPWQLVRQVSLFSLALRSKPNDWSVLLHQGVRHVGFPNLPGLQLTFGGSRIRVGAC